MGAPPYLVLKRPFSAGERRGLLVGRLLEKVDSLKGLSSPSCFQFCLPAAFSQHFFILAARKLKGNALSGIESSAGW